MNPLLPTNETIRSAPRGVPPEVWEAGVGRVNEIEASLHTLGTVVPAEAPVVELPQTRQVEAPRGAAVINFSTAAEARQRIEQVLGKVA